jgi:hypothetical protein
VPQRMEDIAQDHQNKRRPCRGNDPVMLWPLVPSLISNPRRAAAADPLAGVSGTRSPVEPHLAGADRACARAEVQGSPTDSARIPAPG